MWFKKSLLAKLLVGMLISAVIPLSLSILVSYRTTSHSVENQLISINQQAMDSSIYYLKRYLDDVSRISVSFYYDPVLMGYLRSKTFADYNQRLYISNQVYNIYKERPEFRAVRFTSSNTGDIFTNSAFLRLGEGDLETISTPETDEEGWTETHGYEVTKVNGETMLAFHKPIIDYPRSTRLGILSFFIGPDEFERIMRPFTPAAFSEGEQVLLMIRKDQKLLYATDETVSHEPFRQITANIAAGYRGYEHTELDGDEGVMVYVTDEYKGLPLVLAKFIPLTVVNESANEALRRSLFIPVMMTAIVLICSFILSYIVIAPIKRLVRNMAQVQSGNFVIRPIPKRQDELGVLEFRFQSMVRGLDDLMNREYRNRLELTTARLKMLQAQINPHFLYNSLQSIGTLALRQGVTEVNDKIAELGFILRYSMDIETETVPLQKEIEHIEHYLSLQTGRFKNKLSYTLSCPPEALHIKVPKMILQPIVENSIIHGIEKGSGSGTIHIGIELTEELTIRVMDNGKGIGPDMMEHIKREYGGRQLVDGRERGIGLVNVLGRLRLRYENEFSWDIHSVPFEATVITLRMPTVLPQEGQSHQEEEEGGSDEGLDSR